MQRFPKLNKALILTAALAILAQYLADVLLKCLAVISEVLRLINRY